MKKKCFGLLVISLLVLSLGLYSTSYAMYKSEAFEYCRDNCGLSNLFNAPSENNGNTLLTYNNFLTYLDNQTNNYMFVKKTSTSTSNTEFDILFYDTFSINGNNYSGKVNNTRSGSRKSCYSFNNYYNTSALTQSSSNTSDGTFPTATNTFYMVYGNGEIIAASFDLPITSRFIPSFDYHVSVNNIQNVNCLLRNWSINQWKLGETEDYSTLDSFHMYLYDLGNNVEIGYVYAYREQDIISGGNALYFSEGNLYANSRYMLHNNLYRLYIEKYKDGVDSSEEYYFIFLPRNAVVSNGQIISVGSGDFNVQDSTNAIAEEITNTDNIQPTLDNITSGDIYQKFGYKIYNSNFATFIFDMFMGLKDRLLLDSGNVSFTFPYMNTTITINSDDFTTPPGLIKGFVSTILTFGVFVLIYQHITGFYHRLQEGNLDELLTYTDVDDETFLM